MDQKSLISEIVDYCAKAGIKPSTLSVRALGNSRFFARLVRRDAQIGDAAHRIRAYMEQNPPRCTETARTE
jgi:hypothetical protein